MGNNKYKWTLGNSPPPIDAHSQNKHKIYHDYLKRYVTKFTQNPRHPSFKFFYIDGFCGGGVYRDKDNREHLGSPFIIFDAVKNVLNTVLSKRKNPLKVDFRCYFVDKDQDAIDYLKKAHRDRGIDKHNGQYCIEYLCGSFENLQENIIKNIKGYAPRTQRCLFILDQYGWRNVPIRLINDIFNNLSDAEIILTFSPDDIIDRVGVNNIHRIKSGFDYMGFDLSPTKLLDTIKDPKQTDKWVTRTAAQRLLLDEFQGTARYMTNYYIQRANRHRKIMLVHLSHHQTARDEMMSVHWGNFNMDFSHQGYAGSLNLMMGYNQTYDNQFGYFDDHFFQESRNKVIDCLYQEIPVILENREGITFSNLIDNLISDAPATKKIIQEASSNMLNNKQLTVMDHQTKKIKYRASNIHPRDIISKSINKYFDFK